MVCILFFVVVVLYLCVCSVAAACLPSCNYNMHDDLILLCQEQQCIALDLKLKRKTVCTYFQYADYIPDYIFFLLRRGRDGGSEFDISAAAPARLTRSPLP